MRMQKTKRRKRKRRVLVAVACTGLVRGEGGKGERACWAVAQERSFQTFLQVNMAEAYECVVLLWDFFHPFFYSSSLPFCFLLLSPKSSISFMALLFALPCSFTSSFFSALIPSFLSLLPLSLSFFLSLSHSLLGHLALRPRARRPNRAPQQGAAYFPLGLRTGAGEDCRQEIAAVSRGR